MCATLAAFIFKFLIDKYFVFKINSHNAKFSKKYMVFMYTLISFFTTIFFWGTQFLFRIYLNQEYLGMVIGLTIGYTIKFLLDKEFVFVNNIAA